MEKHDLIIIGGGPAGLTAALYAGRSRLDTLLIEKMALGGRILTSEIIENYPGFPGGISTAELMSRMESQVKELGLKIVSEEVLGLDGDGIRVNTAGGDFTAGAVIIASGARPRKLNVPGEEQYTGRGVSYCATCDAPFFKAKKVVVVGGGNAVAEEAMYLSRFASSVSIIHRRGDLRASPILQERMKQNPKINFILNSIVSQIKGSNKVESVRVKDLLSGQESDLVCDGVFIYIGYEPDTVFAKNKIKMDETGFIITDENMATSAPGIFACGDCRKKGFYQVINACGDGAVAADSAYKFISKSVI
ncbi:MAG TPA: thioredoxin-disulfide reductase [Candidatus Omnitrophota bacterium]|nr:thioredoxin-disulfide reductase [Candidatus Omnitrophota bacterium]HPT39405.1 thioredoxin-disulfide reductase [Candidatus Omnitrophota bacterium]